MNGKSPKHQLQSTCKTVLRAIKGTIVTIFLPKHIIFELNLKRDEALAAAIYDNFTVY